MCERVSLTKKWTVFGLSSCPYTRDAIGLLKRHYGGSYDDNVSFVVIDDKKVFKTCMRAKTNNHMTFPMIFFKKRFVGGYDDIRNIFKNI